MLVHKVCEIRCVRETETERETDTETEREKKCVLLEVRYKQCA